MTALLPVQARIITSGDSIELQTAPYRLEAAAFGERQVSHRKTEQKNRYVEGTFISDAVRENVMETVNVFVDGGSARGLRLAVDRLTEAFEEISYTIRQVFDDNIENWNCFLADYTIRTPHEFRFSTKALVTAQVPRLPQVYYEEP